MNYYLLKNKAGQLYVMSMLPSLANATEDEIVATIEKALGPNGLPYPAEVFDVADGAAVVNETKLAAYQAALAATRQAAQEQEQSKATARDARVARLREAAATATGSTKDLIDQVLASIDGE